MYSDDDESRGLVPVSTGAGDADGARSTNRDVIDLRILDDMDAYFETIERDRGVSEECIENSRSFCFLCTYRSKGHTATDPRSQRILKTIEEFEMVSDELRGAADLIGACRDIKTFYELHVRGLLPGVDKYTYTLRSIAIHILDHDTRPLSIRRNDIEVHKIVMRKLSQKMLTPDDDIDPRILTAYISVSNNFNRHYGKPAKGGAQFD